MAGKYLPLSLGLWKSLHPPASKIDGDAYTLSGTMSLSLDRWIELNYDINEFLLPWLYLFNIRLSLYNCGCDLFMCMLHTFESIFHNLNVCFCFFLHNEVLLILRLSSQYGGRCFGRFGSLQYNFLFPDEVVCIWISHKWNLCEFLWIKMKFSQ